MKNECFVVSDLLPLYREEMLSNESATFVREHLERCSACRKKYEELACEIPLQPESNNASSLPLKGFLKRINRWTHSLAYALIIFFIFLGFGFTQGSDVMYNTLIMPIVGVFGYITFGWRSIYKMPILLLGINLFAALLKMVEMDLLAACFWALIFSAFVLAGILIAGLLHYALKKEDEI